MNSARLALLLFPLALAACRTPPVPGATGTLEIRFELLPTNDEEIVPTYQTVVWLEDERGLFLRSLFVSQYTAYGGFQHNEVCPDWNFVANWAAATEEQIDGVTGATPYTEPNALTIDCGALGLRPGVYHYCIQTHIVEDYNVLGRGRIEIGGAAGENEARIEFTPSRHTEAGAVLCNVTARYSR